MSALEIATAYAVIVGYGACIAGPIWFFGDTLLWVWEQTNEH